MQGSGAVGLQQLVLIGQGAISLDARQLSATTFSWLSTIICETEKGMGSKNRRRVCEGVAT